MAVFVSYARPDRDAVHELRVDLEHLGREVWIDEKVIGGQEWWDEILTAIRDCDLFVWTVSPRSVKSTACRSELAYALKLDRPVLPIMISPVAISLTPERIANSQIIDYTTRGADRAIRLAGDLNAVSAPPPLPAPLPPAPPIPVTYLAPFADEIRSGRELSSLRQRELLDRLRAVAASLDDPDDAGTALSLLRELRSRSEITYEAAMIIDQLLHQPRPGTDRKPPPPPPVTAPIVEPRPVASQPIQPSQYRQPIEPSPPGQQPPPGQYPPAGQYLLPGQYPPPGPPHERGRYGTGVMVVLVVVSAFSLGFPAIIAGLVGLVKATKRGQGAALLLIGIGILVLSVIAIGQGANCDPSVSVC